MAANQGSRAGLISTVVVLSIISVVAIIFAFWYGAEKRKVELETADLKKQYVDLISPSALSGDDMAQLKALRGDAASGIPRDAKVWDVAMGQRNDLVKLITGGTGSVASATKDVATRLAEANEKFKSADAHLPSLNDNLLGAIDVLADRVKSEKAALADRDVKLADAEKRVLDTVAAKDADLKAKDDSIAAARAETDKGMKDVGDDRTRQQGVLSDIEKSRDAERKASQEAMAKKDVDLKAKDQQLKSVQDQMKAVQARLNRIRIGVTDPIMRHGNGMITAISGKDIVYINLGQGKQIVPGMTFEVYDANKGIPKMGDPLEVEQIAGKASIEVVRVLDDNSECRVTRAQLGKQIMIGDIIMNVVYDPTIKYNFYVFGKFDLDRNGVATLGDTDVVKHLITAWGAKVVDKVNADTDFVVVGMEPVVPNFTQEDLADPLNAKKLADAQAELDQYQNVLQQAHDMHIPIMNQNRFLYFTGQESLIGR